MINYLLRKLLGGLAVLAGVVVLVFFLFNVIPGDPAKLLQGQRSDSLAVEAVRKDLGLDKPKSVQFLMYVNDLSPVSYLNFSDVASHYYADSVKYGSWFKLIPTGKSSAIVLKEPYLRRSYVNRLPVTVMIAESFPKTALLAVVAMLIALLLGIPAGIVSALRKDSWIDRSILLASVAGMSLPSFFAAILMAWIFAYLLGDITGLNLVGSLYSVDDFGEGQYLDLKNLILPAITLGIRPLAVIGELTRSSMLEVMRQDYIRTARAKGLGINAVVMRHALRNAMNPVVTAASGWLAGLLAGAVFVEYVFDWKGMGVMIVEALNKQDFPVVMGVVLFISVLLILINIFVDLVYALLDPRVRLS
jgi:peptide/nickel transport system permease protein